MQKTPSVTYTHYLIAVWDVLVWSLVLLPIITGGIWIDKPSIKLELAQVTIPVIFVSLLGAFLKFFRNYPLEKASSLRFLVFLWSKWVFFNQKKAVLTLVIGSFGVGTLWCFASLFRHWSYHSGAQDLGIFTSAIWNLVSGHGYISSVKGGMNLFADHQSPTFWLFAPVFYFFPYSETLLVVQAFGLSFGALALRKISIQYLEKNHWGILLTPILYWAYLPLRNANTFDFHPEVLMLPLFLVCITCLQSQNIKSRIFGFFILILALGCKESAGPVCMGIGLAYFFNAGPQATLGFTKRLGPVLIILGILAFYFDTQLVPRFFNNTYVYNIVYSHFGNDLKDLFFSPFLQPILFWKYILGYARLKFLFITLASLCFLPVFNWRCLLAALPGYLMPFLSAGDSRVNKIFHYAIEPSVGLFWALPLACLNFEKFLSIKNINKKIFLSIWICFWGFAMFDRSEIFRIRRNIPSSHHMWLTKVLLPSLQEKTWASSSAIVPHLTHLMWAQELPALKIGKSEKLVDCVLADDNMLIINAFHLIYQCNNVKIYERIPNTCLAHLPMYCVN